MKTLIGLLPDSQHVAHAQEALRMAGIGEDGVSILSRPAEVWQRLGGRKKLTITYKYVLSGAGLGLLVGALYGIPAGLLNCGEMGCPMTTSTALLAVITIYWILGGAFLGAIIGADRLEQDLYTYVEGVRGGKALLIVQSPDEQAPEVSRILHHDEGLLVRGFESGS